MNVVLAQEGFELVNFIEEGGFARVFEVRWKKYPNKQFVAKIMTLDEKTDKEKIESYANELNTLRCLSHPNVIYIFHHFNYANFYCLILEYCKNGNMFDYIESHGPLTVDQFKKVAKQCLEAICKSHQRNIAHLDIKPSNILLTDTNVVKLCDFGMARFKDKNDFMVSSKHGGSVYYYSPERFICDEFNPFMADIWSLGITFYYFTVGYVPWEGETVAELVFGITKDELCYPPQLDEEITQMIDMMTYKDHRKRPTALDLLNLPFFTRRQPKDVKKEIAKRLITRPKNRIQQARSLTSMNDLKLATFYTKVTMDSH